MNYENIAFISVDNTQTFENEKLNELYVAEGEMAAEASKEVLKLCKKAGIVTINVLEEHPAGHISFASSYNNKELFEDLTYDEVKDWTEDMNQLAPEAAFTLDQLKSYMKKVGIQKLWPDHAVVNTQGAELQEPLTEDDFDLKVIKGDKGYKDAYSGFDDTDLDILLKNKMIKKVIIGGVATDFCVGATALDAIKAGYKVTIVREAVRGVTPETTAKKIQELKKAGVKFIALEKLFSPVK